MTDGEFLNWLGDRLEGTSMENVLGDAVERLRTMAAAMGSAADGGLQPGARATIGVAADGLAGFARVGGFTEYVGIKDGSEPFSARAARAARNALANLRDQVGLPHLEADFDASHPYYVSRCQRGGPLE